MDKITPSLDNSLPKIDLLTDQTLDLGSEHAWQTHWQETGECRQPTVIGNVTIDAESLDYLQRALSDDSIESDRIEFLSDDEEIASHEAELEGVDVPGEKTRRILRTLWESFSDSINQDIARSPQAERLSITNQNIIAGEFGGEDNPHIDTHISGELRYLLTVSGPTTTFYTGNLGRDYFDDEGDLVDKGLPADVTSVSAPENGIVRFMINADPHCAPETEGRVFRIFLDATVALQPETLPN